MTSPVYTKNFGYSINMSDPQQKKIQNEIEQIKKEINLLQGRLKKNEKSQNQFQNGLIRIKKIGVNKDRGSMFFKPKNYKIY